MAHIRVHICCVIRTLADGSGRRPSSGWSHHAYSICLVIVGRYSIELNITPSSRLHKIIIYRATTCVALSEREILIIATNQHPLEHCVLPHLWLRLAGRNRSIGINRICSDRTKQRITYCLYLTGFEYMHTVYIYITYMSHLIGIRNRELPGEVFSIAILDLDVAGLSVSFCWIFAVMWQPILIIYLSSFIDRDATRDFWWVIIYFVHFQLTTHHLSYFTILLAYICPVSAYICCRPSIVFGYVAKTYAVTSSTWRITSDNRALGALACRRRRYNLGENRTNRWTHNLITQKASPVNPHTIVWMYIYIHVDG